MKKAPKNMASLAEDLGLSRVTVSHVLNNKWRENRISKTTAKKVLDYVRKTGFSPNFMGLALKGKITKDVAILLPDKCIEHHQKAFFRFLQIIKFNNLSYMVLPFTGLEEELTSIGQQLQTFKVKKVIFIATVYKTGNLISYYNRLKLINKIECIFYDFDFKNKITAKMLPQKGIKCIGFNRDKAEEEVFKYIKECGYEKVFLANDYNDFLIYPKLLKKYKFKFDKQTVFEPYYRFEPPWEVGAMIAEDLLKLPDIKGSRAIYIRNDLKAIGAIDYLLKNGKRIPEDFAIISWDGLPESKFFKVPLTSLEVPFYKMIDAFEECLISKDGKTKTIELQAKILQGQSM